MSTSGLRPLLAATAVTLAYCGGIALTAARDYGPNDRTGLILDLAFGLAPAALALLGDVALAYAVARDRPWRRGFALARLIYAVPYLGLALIILAIGLFISVCEGLGARGDHFLSTFSDRFVPMLGYLLPPFLGEAFAISGCRRARS